MNSEEKPEDTKPSRLVTFILIIIGLALMPSCHPDDEESDTTYDHVGILG